MEVVQVLKGIVEVATLPRRNESSSTLLLYLGLGVRMKTLRWCFGFCMSKFLRGVVKKIVRLPVPQVAEQFVARVVDVPVPQILKENVEVAS